MPYFSFEYSENKTILGLIEEHWIWFFDYFSAHHSKISAPENGLKILFVCYSDNKELTQQFKELN